MRGNSDQVCCIGLVPHIRIPKTEESREWTYHISLTWASQPFIPNLGKTASMRKNRTSYCYFYSQVMLKSALNCITHQKTDNLLFFFSKENELLFIFQMCKAQMWYSYLEYKILQNEYKEWKNVFLHENRLFTNLLNISGKKEWIITCKIDKLYLELGCCIYLPVFILRKHIHEKKNRSRYSEFSLVCCIVLSMNLQLTAVKMELALKWGPSPKWETPDRTQEWLSPRGNR